jgi:phthiocerol/phenolphthiocerol synthesis type-I polyketide synthase C
LHAIGRILEAAKKQQIARIKPIPSSAARVNKEEHYALTTHIGLNYGPAFQGLAACRISDDCLEADVKMSVEVDAEDGYIIHPAMLDLCFQSLVDFFRHEIESDRGIAFLPTKIGRLNYYSAMKPIKFRARLKRFSMRSVLADFELFDVDGNLVANVSDCRFRSAPLINRKSDTIDQWETVPLLRPHPLDALISHFHDAKQIISFLQQSTSANDLSRQAWFKETLPLLEALTVSYVFEAFQKIALKHNINKLIQSNNSPLLCWLTNLLIKENLLLKVNDKWQVVVDSDVPSSNEIWQYLQNSMPTSSSQLLLMGRIGVRLPALITGALDGKTYQGDLEKSISAERLYDNDPAYIGVFNAIERAILLMADQVTVGRKLRVLEIVSGPTALPRRLLGKMPSDTLDYVIAVSEEHIAEQLHADYHTYTNVTIAHINLSSGELTVDQGIPAFFDIVVMRHTLHRFTDPQAFIKQTAKRLTQGGVALVAERYPDACANIIGGIDSSWWHIDEATDGTISNVISPLFPPEAWMQALLEDGFDDVENFTENDSSGLAQGAYLIIAKRPNDVVIHTQDLQAQTWLFITDSATSNIANQLKVKLESQSQTVMIADSIANIDSDIHHVVSLLGWDATEQDATKTLSQLLHTVQHLASLDTPPHLHLMTKGGALCNHASIDANPVQAALWGFGRVVMNEYSALNCKMIDIGIQSHGSDAVERIAHELLIPDGADEIILTDEARYSLLIQEKKAKTAISESATESRYHLDFLTAGQLRNLIWLPSQQQPLLDNQVEVQTKAVGLNFRDIMYLMGLLPDEAVENGFAGASLGLEFSGVVTRVGKAVKDYAIGQSVMGFGSSCFGSHVVTRNDAIAPMPASWTFEAAATVPTTFFTVYYSLKHLADIQPGEKVLIHGAAGGVGIAAIQLARHLGAEIFATAGSEEKRDFVQLLGADHVFDSRTLDFADDIAIATGGEGVDVILNSLAGEAIRRNLSILKPFGRFLELGKRDFFENTPVGLRPFKDNISYFGIDADQLLINRPALAHQLFREVMDLFAAGAFTPLPHRIFDASCVIDAFRVMQQARHIGKIVVSLDNAKPNIQHQKEKLTPVKLDANSTWLVTGGLSGFGLESAKTLIKHGVKNIVLISRRGIHTPGATAAVAELKLLGIKVLALSCDITDKVQLANTLDQIQQEMPPLKGIIHAAMVIDDQLMSNLNEASIKAVLDPKLLGAWHLHTLTQKLSLEYFILYSSITTYIGNPGQGNYVAANAGLEGLAALRKQLGLPANCIGWGPIADAGYLTRNQAIKESLGQRLGSAPLLANAALEQLDSLLRVSNSNSAIANFDWRVLSNLLPSASALRFSQLNSTLSNTNGIDDSIDFKAMIVGKNRAEVAQVVTDMIIYEVSAILCINADRIHPRRSLNDLGMDSLMAVELALGLERRFGIQLPVMMLNESPNAEKVALRIVDQLMGEQESEIQDTEALVVQDLVRQHGEQLSVDEMKNVMQDFSKLN